jgi:excinuclease UvrABC nuclease subunit
MSKCCLYRHFDAGGDLLYVGMSRNAAARLRGHKNASWYDDIASITIEHFETKAAAADAEWRAIQDEHPKFNKLRYPRKAAAAAYAALDRQARRATPHQLYPAGCAFLAIRRAVEECDRVLQSGGDPYAAS